MILVKTLGNCLVENSMHFLLNMWSVQKKNVVMQDKAKWMQAMRVSLVKGRIVLFQVVLQYIKF